MQVILTKPACSKSNLRDVPAHVQFVGPVERIYDRRTSDLMKPHSGDRLVQFMPAGGKTSSRPVKARRSNGIVRYSQRGLAIRRSRTGVRGQVGLNIRSNLQITSGSLLQSIAIMGEPQQSKPVDYASTVVSSSIYGTIISVGLINGVPTKMTINDRNFLQRVHLDAAPVFPAFPDRIPSRKDRDPSQTVVVGDCLDLLRDMDANSIDAVVTSPPYNIGIRYRSYHDSRPRSEYLAWMEEIASQISRVLADDGSVFINLGAGPDPWISTDVAAEFRKHLKLQNRISWVKNISIGEKSIGHFKPVNSQRYLNRTREEIFHFTKRGDVKIDRLAVGVPYQDKSNIDRWRHARSDRRCAGNADTDER